MKPWCQDSSPGVYKTLSMAGSKWLALLPREKILAMSSTWFCFTWLCAVLLIFLRLAAISIYHQIRVGPVQSATAILMSPMRKKIHSLSLSSSWMEMTSSVERVVCHAELPLGQNWSQHHETFLRARRPWCLDCWKFLHVLTIRNRQYSSYLHSLRHTQDEHHGCFCFTLQGDPQSLLNTQPSSWQTWCEESFALHPAVSLGRPKWCAPCSLTCTLLRWACWRTCNPTSLGIKDYPSSHAHTWVETREAVWCCLYVFKVRRCLIYAWWQQGYLIHICLVSSILYYIYIYIIYLIDYERFIVSCTCCHALLNFQL